MKKKQFVNFSNVGVFHKPVTIYISHVVAINATLLISIAFCRHATVRRNNTLSLFNDHLVLMKLHFLRKNDHQLYTMKVL